uniref:Uncharacterized protein n=1 Tax=Kalanchoe fedtschenkoi TaxID=63787 RepID=A0A7N0RC20_KALFE
MMLLPLRPSSLVSESSIDKVVWLPAEFGQAVACIFADGSFALWEETAQDGQELKWKLCVQFLRQSIRVLDLQFGTSGTRLKMVAAYSDGYVRVYELPDPLKLDIWQLQGEFLNMVDSITNFGKATCFSSCISWNPCRDESQPSSFVVGFSSDIPQLNSSKVWEFDDAHHRWLPVAELSLPGDNGDCVSTVAWAPNIGRPFEIIAIATGKGISVWNIGSNPDPDGRLSVERAAFLSAHGGGEVWQMVWDMSGMTLASTGADGVVRLWQSNLNGVWHEQASIVPT